MKITAVTHTGPVETPVHPRTPEARESGGGCGGGLQGGRPPLKITAVTHTGPVEPRSTQKRQRTEGPEVAAAGGYRGVAPP